jgi:Spy/CpxP family protein refolding chaperone
MREDGNRMKRDKRRAIKLMISSAAVLLFSLSAAVSAQTNPTQSSPGESQAQSQNAQTNQGPDLRFLNLTPEQIEKIRAINEELEGERQAAGIRLRQARRALGEAVASPTPNEALIEQRSREFAEAHANTVRVRSLSETRIFSQVLTPEQRMRVQEVRRNMALRAVRQQQQRQNGLGQRQGLRGGANNPALAPAQRRVLRRQQKP